MTNDLTYDDVAKTLNGAGWMILSKEERQQVLRDLKKRSRP